MNNYSIELKAILMVKIAFNLILNQITILKPRNNISSLWYPQLSMKSRF